MASGRDVIDIPVAPGMRQDIDSTLLPVGTPRYLQNVRCYQQGRLDKRPGTKLIGTSGLPDDGSVAWLSQQSGRAMAGIQVADSEDRVSQKLYGQETADDAAAWAELGSYGGIVPVRRFGVSPQSTTGAKHLSSVRVGDLLYVSYTEVSGSGNRTNLQVVTLDGTVLRARALSDATNSRLAYDGTRVVILYCDTSSTGGDDIVLREIDQDDASFGSPFTFVTSGGTDFDVAPLEGTTHWLLAAAVGTSIGVYRFSLTGSSGTSTTITTTGAASNVGVAGYTSGHVLVGWVEAGGSFNGDAKVSFRNATTLALVATHTVDSATTNEIYRYQIGFVRRTATSWVMTMGGADETTVSPQVPFAYFKFASVTSASASSPRKVSCYGLASKPFIAGTAGGENVVYVWAHTQGDSTKWKNQAAHFILALNTDTAATSQASYTGLAAISYEHLATYGLSTAFMSQLPTVESFGDGLFAAPLNWSDPTLTGVDVAVFTAARRADSIAGVHRYAKDLSGALVVSGGWLYEHTGARASSIGFIVENGFAYEPELVTALASGGSLTADREYTYRAVYRWTDALGRVHRSAPSEPVTATPTGSQLSVLIGASDMRVSGRYNVTITDIVLEYYRSWLGGPYYRCGALSLRSLSEPVFTDTTADSAVEQNEVLYTDLGILPTEPPSGARLWCDGGTRVFTVGWRENVVQFSKLLIASAPVEFVDDDAFRIFLPEPIVAIWVLDGVPVIFCRAGVYTVSGEGPSDQGVGQYSEPRRLPVTVSCDEPRSLLEVSQGLLYRGGATLWLLPRGFAPPIPVGDAIHTYFEAYPYVIAAAVTDRAGSEGSARCAQFVLAAADTDGSPPIVAVYDLELGSWSIDVVSGPSIGASTAIDGRLWWAASVWTAAADDVPVRCFDASEFQDYYTASTPAWIETRVELGYVRPFGMLGWGLIPRVQLFGLTLGACRLTLSGTVNDYPFAEATHEFTSTAFSSYLEHSFENTPGNSVQLSLTDSVGDPDAPTYTAGYSIRGLALEVQPEKGLRRVKPETERF